MRPMVGFLVCFAVGCAGSARDRLRDLDRPADADTTSRRPATKAGRLEVTPTSKANRVNAEQILIATFYDRDGTARSRRRVEWTLEGPGKIVATDEGGFLPNRGRQLDPKYAVVYTNTFRQTVKDDRGREVEVHQGQTYCVVTSPVEGRTTVTAYAPDLGDGGRVVAKLTWGDGQFRPSDDEDATPRDPDTTPRETTSLTGRPTASDGAQVSLDVKTPRAVGVNQETPVTISLANVGKVESQPLTVKATIPDHAEFVKADPPAIRRSGNTFTWAFEGLPGAKTQDITLIVRPTKKAVLNVVATAETADGMKAEQRAGSDVDSAGMRVKVEAPTYVTTGEDAKVRVTVTNTGNVPVSNAVAWVDVPDLKRDPLEKSVGTIAAKESKTVSVPVAFDRAGKFAVRVNVTANGGLADRGDATVTVGRAELELTISGPESIPVRQDGLFEYRVTNRGDTAVADVKVQTTLPRGVTASTATENGKTAGGGATWAVGTLAAGESKVVRLNTTGDRQGDRLAVTATADGELASGARVSAKGASTAVSVVGLPVLTMEVADPVGPVRVGGRAVFRVTVRNRGNASAHDVVLSADATEELRPSRGSGPNSFTAKVADQKLTFPSLTELPAGSTATFTIETEAATAGSSILTVHLKSKELTAPIKEEQGTKILGQK